MKKSLKRVMAASLAFGLAFPAKLVGPAFAADIDIYSANTGSSANPNVLIVLDNSTNWSRNEQHWEDVNGGVSTTQGEMELKALRTVIGELSSDVNVGLMMMTEGSGGSTVDGGYIRFDVRAMDATNKTALQALIGNPAGCTDGANSVNGTPNCILQNYASTDEKVATAKSNYSNALFEIFKYSGGYTSPAHVNDNVAGTPTDSSHFGPTRYCGDPTSSGWRADGGAFATQWTTYDPPIGSNSSCAKTYVIWIGNDPNLNVDAAASLLSGVGGNTSAIALPDLTASTSSQEYLLATIPCSTYTSVEQCQTAAAADAAYAGYSNLRCQEAGQCSAGSSQTITTNLGTSNCGEYANADACRSALELAEGTNYGSYSCTVANPNCTYTSDSWTTLDNYATCVSGSNANDCQAAATILWPGYTAYTCSNKQNPSPCSGSGNNKWLITAKAWLPGTTYTKTGSTTTTVAETTTSYAIYGTSTFNTYTATGTYSAPTTNHYADEWTRFLNQTDINSASGQQNVSTYVIDVRRRWQNDGDRDKTRLLMSMARSGGGKYYNAQDENAIKNALRQIFSEIQSVNSVFASSSLPVSVNTQGTYLNQVFMGMFRPDGGSKPRWAGNLKQYKFRVISGALKLADKNNEAAISATTGFISPCADSFWTTDTGTYWNFSGSNSVGNCSAQTSAFPSAGSSSAYSDAPDGDVVEKGGAAQRLRGVTSSGGTLTSSSTRYAVCGAGQTPATHSCRKLLTCDGSSTTSCATNPTTFETSNAALTAAAFGVSTDSDKNNLVNWVRGQDLDDENGNAGTTANEVRPSVHGGVIHSQPAVVDFGTPHGVVVFYGADDGVLHAVDGGQTDSEGVELWGFIAPETFGRLNRLKTNSPLVSYPTTSGTITPAPTAKDYFFDGPIGVHQSGSTVWIFPTMRRGGRAIYAFDVSDPTSPTIKWRKGCFTNSTSDDSSCSTDGLITNWSAIGQTWSKPQVITLSGSTTPVLVFGGGFDTCEDTDSQSRCASTPRKGAGVWFVNADTGGVLRYYPTNYSVPGDVAVLKDTSGNATHVYAADTGGYIYRINVGTYANTGSGTGWSSNSAATDIDIADLSATANKERKFLFGPSVVKDETFNAVLIGSGDREHPLWTSYACNSGTGGVTNQFFMLKDTPNDYAANIVANDTDLYNVTGLAAPVQATLDAKKGWRFSLNACEQVVNKPLTVAGWTYFGTNTPISTSAACTTNLGTARGYAVNFLTGAGNASPTTYVGGGMPPSAVAGVVTLDAGDGGGSAGKQPFCIGCGGGPDNTNCPPGTSPLEGKCVEVNPSGQRYRVYWYLMSD